jgi:ATP-dependent Clp protease adaptor protein ClpS
MPVLLPYRAALFNSTNAIPFAAVDAHLPKAGLGFEDDETALLEREEAAVKPPPRYAVYLLNDDYTPMEFVVAVLQRFFNKNSDESIAIMLKVHTEGRGVCGVYTKDIAFTRVDQVMSMAAHFQHPLQCIAEPMDDE